MASSSISIAERKARDFGTVCVLEGAGILCVFQACQNALWGKRAAVIRGAIYERLPKEKGSGANCHSPRMDSRFAMSDYFAVVVPLTSALKQTGPYGPWHGGGQAPCGRWK